MVKKESLFILYPMFYVKCSKTQSKCVYKYNADITWASLTFNFRMFLVHSPSLSLARCTWFYDLRSSLIL